MIMRLLKSTMILAGITLSFSIWAQEDRQIYIDQLKNEETVPAALSALYEKYQLGGVRTVIRNLNEMPTSIGYSVIQTLGELDLWRFRNDMIANVETAQTTEQKALAVYLLAELARRVDPATFQELISASDTPDQVKMAAFSGLLRIRKPEYFDQFLDYLMSLEKEKKYSLDLYRFFNFRDISQALFYYYKPKLEDRKFQNDAFFKTILHFVPKGETDLYEKMVVMRQKDHFPLMYTAIIKNGDVAALDFLVSHKKAKKMVDELETLRPLVMISAKGRKGALEEKPQHYPIGSFLLRDLPQPLIQGVALVRINDKGIPTVLEQASLTGQPLTYEQRALPRLEEWRPLEETQLLYSF
jgi:hypothetical protein